MKRGDRIVPGHKELLPRAIADAAGLGTIEVKAMKDHGYPTEFAVGVTAASCTVGPIIPPSLPFVIYGMMAGVSIGQLFLAGVIPGLIMGATMMLTVAYYAPTRKYQADATFSWRKLAKIFVEAFLAMMTPVLLVGGMTLGIFTPTEGAIAASAWALLLGLVWYRTLTWRMLVKISMDTIETTAMVLFIVAAASIFGWLLTVPRVTEDIAGSSPIRRTRRCSCCSPTCCCCSSAASSSRWRRSSCWCRS